VTIYRVYDSEGLAAESLSAVEDNLREIAIAAGYEVIDGVIYGKTNDVVNTEANGTTSWAPVIRIDATWGFLDPVTYRPDSGDTMMRFVPEGIVIDYVETYPDD
jgi:hypothetical protein